jgi:hypothetical protein
MAFQFYHALNITFALGHCFQLPELSLKIHYIYYHGFHILASTSSRIPQ